MATETELDHCTGKAPSQVSPSMEEGQDDEISFFTLTYHILDFLCGHRSVQGIGHR